MQVATDDRPYAQLLLQCLSLTYPVHPLSDRHSMTQGADSAIDTRYLGILVVCERASWMPSSVPVPDVFADIDVYATPVGVSRAWFHRSGKLPAHQRSYVPCTTDRSRCLRVDATRGRGWDELQSPGKWDGHDDAARLEEDRGVITKMHVCRTRGLALEHGDVTAGRRFGRVPNGTVGSSATCWEKAPSTEPNPIA